MHYMKPGEAYRIVTVQLLVPEEMWNSGAAQDGISALLSDTAGDDGVVADWAYTVDDADLPRWVASDDPEEGDFIHD